MRFHDYHLKGYEVSEFGETIAFHLVYDYPNTKKDESRIRFSDVALYNFVHTSGAIITDIEELPIPDFVREMGDQLSEWNRMYGLRHWKDSLSEYSLKLKSDGYKVWSITSAIGFYGFVIAKAVNDA
jgi:hypothetical protein